MHVFEVSKGCKQLECIVLEGINTQDGTQIKDLLFKGRVGYHQLLLVEEADEIGEGEDTGASRHHYDLSWLGLLQLQALPLGIADEQLFNRTLDYSVAEPASFVSLEHYGNGMP
jgi:hypothetical protein